MRQIFPFLELPYHVRHDIYIFALDYPDLDPVFARIETQTSADEDKHEKAKLPQCILPTPHVPAQLKTTPGIMLCSRQIAWEAQEAMRFKTFTLKRPPPYTQTLGRPMDITEFINEDTLKGIRRVDFIITLYRDCPRAWRRTIETLLDVWSVETHLRRIGITLHQPHPLLPERFFYDRDAVRMLSMVRICLQYTHPDT